MFSRNPYGHLEYAPFRQYLLPEIVPCEQDDEGIFAEFAPRNRDTDGDGFGPPMFRRPLYRLRWPGEGSKANNAQVPADSIGEDLSAAVEACWEPNSASSHYSLHEIVGAWKALDPQPPLPESVAYHLAVNHSYTNLLDRRPAVAGLPANRVDQVLDARFALDQKAVSTLTYLKWAAESEYHNPMYRAFDTNVRESLYGIQHEMVRMYFYLLADHRYDADRRWWDRGLLPFAWYRLATYLHWVGRTGHGLYASHAHIDPAEGVGSRTAAEELQDVVEADRERIHHWLNTTSGPTMD